MSLIIDANGRRPMSVQHEMQLHSAEAEVCDWLGQHIADAMRRAKNGKMELRLDEVKAQLDQIYFLGRNHEAGS